MASRESVSEKQAERAGHISGGRGREGRGELCRIKGKSDYASSSFFP